ncbi:hypothetical protein SDC9_207294 [bioreactor metagenome]|uniref:Uncharacterized protein n=1 Tax=bioreactor metagenome TaxID=1076179 RepID=A0A645JIW6_9ZZZZ
MHSKILCLTGLLHIGFEKKQEETALSPPAYYEN